MQNTVTSWGGAIIASFASAFALFAEAIPRVIGFVVILLIGWFIASLLAKVVASLLRAVKFNDLAERSGFSSFVENMGMETDASGVIAAVAKWFVRLIALVVAFDALGLPAVSSVLQDLLLFLPNVVVALVVLVLAGLAANALASLVRASTSQAGLGNPNFLASLTRITIWGFGIIVAVNQLGVAATLVNTLFIGLVGAIALATGLAFGLGGRDTAGRLVESAYQQGQAAQPQLAKAASAAQDKAKSSSKNSGKDSQETRVIDAATGQTKKS